MSKRKISYENYKKRREWSHSTQEIVQGFDNSMQSPEVPAAAQPQGASRMSLLPPNPKKSKPDIDLTAEPDIAVEQPLPMPPPNLIPHRPPTTSAPGQMSDVKNVVNLIQCFKDIVQSQNSSPSITTQGYNASIINNLARAPIKSQRHHQQWSSGRDDMAGVASRSTSHQSSSVTNATNRSFAPSMASSLPSLQNKAPSVRTSPPKRNSMGSSSGDHSDIKRLPLNTLPPGALLAEAYNHSGYQSSPSGTMTSGERNSHNGAGGRRDSGRQRSSLGEKKAEPVVVIDEDEGEQKAQGHPRHQMRPNASDVHVSRESRKVLPDVRERVVIDGKSSGVLCDYQSEPQRRQRKTEPNSIPPLQELKKEQSSKGKRSPLKLNKPQSTRRLGSKEREVSTSTAASTGNQTGIVQRHTCTEALSCAESDNDVLVVDGTTSKYFETSPVAKGVWPSSTMTPSPDILTKIPPTQQGVGKMKPQDSTSPPIKFVPRCKRHQSPENGHSNSSDSQVASRHRNTFAKNQSPSSGARKDSKSSVSGGKAKPRLPDNILSTTPTLTQDEFFINTDENPAAGKEPKTTKKTPQSKKNDEIIFQAEEPPGGRKQYNMRGRDKQHSRVRVSDSSDGHISCEDDDDFQPQPQPSRKKKATTTNKDNTKSFYGGTLAVVLDVAVENSKKAMDKFNKNRARTKSSGRLLTVKGTTASGRGSVKNVWKEFKVKPKVGKIPKKRTTQLATDEDETTLDLNTIQIGRLVSDGAFSLEIKSRELIFPFEYDKKIYRTIIELKHLTSWKMNLGDGPRFIAVEVDLAMTNKLKNGLVGKFHLSNDFFKQGSQDPSQRYIVFRLAGSIYAQDVANIHEILDGLNGVTLEYCETVKEVSAEEAADFLERVKPSEPARRKNVSLISNTELSEFPLPDKDTSEDAPTITGQSGKASRNELGWVRRSTRQKRPPRRMYGTSHHLAIEDSDSQEEEQPAQRRPKTPNIKLLTYKPQGSKVTLDIMSADVECLDPGEYLNDKIIDFYLNYLLYEKLSEEFRSRVHVFSTFFYTRLSNASMDDKASNRSTPEKIHSRVKTWTRRVDLFLKDYIILPVCDRAHWYVVIVCHPGRFDPSKVKPPQPRKPKSRARSRKSMRLQKKKKNSKGVSTPTSEDIDQGEGGEKEEEEEEASHSEMQDQVLMEDDSLEVKEEEEEATAEDEEVMDMDNISALHESLPAIAEVRSGVFMSTETLETPVTLDLDSTGGGELLEGEHMEQGESPFSQLSIIPETPTSSQDCERTKEREAEAGEERNMGDNSIASSTIVISPDILDSNAAACNDGGSMMSIGRSTHICSEDIIQCIPTVETRKPTADQSSAFAGSAMTGDYISLEMQQVKSIPPSVSDGCQEGEGEPLVDEVTGESGGHREGVPLVDEIIGESVGEDDGSDTEEEGAAVGVESVQVKQELEVEEESEPQAWPCIQILDSLGIKRPTTARRIRNYLTMEWKSKKGDEEDEMSFEHLPLLYPAIPLQDNSSDCGIFVLQFIESLLGTIQQGLPPPSVAEEWASYDKTRAKRKELAELITELQNRDKAS